MLYTCADDFFKHAAEMKQLTREEEKELASKMQQGDEDAKNSLINSYLPILASYIKRYTAQPSLQIIYLGIETLRTSIENYNFQFKNPTFSKYLGNNIRQMMAKYIANS